MDSAELSDVIRQIREVIEFYGPRIESGAGDTKRQMSQLMWDRVHSLIDNVQDPEVAHALCEAFNIEIMDLSDADMAVFREMQIKIRNDWEAVFTAEYTGGVFPQVQWGKTADYNKIYVQGFSDVLDKIARSAVRTRGGGGRFFINQRGVFFKDQLGASHKFVRFDG